jgi:hypothetical protein
VSLKKRIPRRVYQPYRLIHESLTEQLIDTWYKKLAETGFKDIERAKADKKLQTYSHYLATPGGNINFLDVQIKRHYLYLCTRFLYAFDFDLYFPAEPELMRTIWYLHTENISLRGMIRYFQGLPIPKIPEDALYPVPEHLKRKRSVFYYHDKLNMLLPFFHTLRAAGLEDDNFEELIEQVATVDYRVPVERKPKLPPAPVEVIKVKRPKT